MSLDAVDRLLGGALSDTFDQHRFVVVDRSDNGPRPGLLVIESPNITAAFSQEGQSVFLTLRPRGDARWFMVGLVRYVLDGSGAYSDVVDDECVRFLQSWLPRLEEMFANDQDRSKIIEQLVTGKSARADFLFGPIHAKPDDDTVTG